MQFRLRYVASKETSTEYFSVNEQSVNHFAFNNTYRESTGIVVTPPKNDEIFQ